MLFRKIVSNLPFSPALVGQLGFYAKRLRGEQVTRRIGLLFTVLALIVQWFAIFKPAEPALATNPNNIVFNGISSKSDLLNAWDKNTDGHGHRDIQQIFKYFLGQDFSRKDLESTAKGSFGSRDTKNGGRILSLGRTQQTSDPAQQAHSITDANGKKSIIWSRHLSAFDTGANKRGRGSIYQAFIGSHNGRWFAVMSNCGNLAFSDSYKPPSITPVLTTKATCSEITGYAYDQAHLSTGLPVYIYIGGDPGTGEKYTTTANQSTPAANVSGKHGYHFAVPSKYKTGKKYAYTVIITTSSNQSAQLSGTIDTKSCVQPTPVAQCQSLQATPITGKKDTYKLVANGSVAGGAKITGYHFTVAGPNGAKAFDKAYTSSTASYTSEPFTLTQPGSYTSKVVVLTSAGEKTGTNCTHPLTVAPPEQCQYNPKLPADDKDCRPCSGDNTIWYKDERCRPQIIQYKTVKNLTQNKADASGTTVKPGDRLGYTLLAQNVGKTSTTVNLSEDLTDVLEYANLGDFGATTRPNTTFNQSSHVLQWKNITLAPGQKFTQAVVVSVKDPIPATPRSASNPESFDCQMVNLFGGSSVSVKVQCPSEKAVENTTHALPETGTGTNILFGSVLLVVVTYFYMRSRQLNKELKLLRKEFNYGTI